MTPKNWACPQFGDVLCCRFPYGGQASTERHPCLVLETSQVQEGMIRLILAGGSSSNKSGRWEKPPSPVDFLVQGPHLRPAGLAHPTKFRFEAVKFAEDGEVCAGTVLTLPYTQDFFVAVAPTMTPKAGHIDISGQASVREAFLQASKAANLKEILDTEKARYLQQPEMLLRPKPKIRRQKPPRPDPSL
jgi:hypothetical protein